MAKVIRLRSLLCPVDFSPVSLRAFNYCIRLAKNYDARLHLLHVIKPPIPTAYDGYVDMGELIESLRQHAESEMKRLKKAAIEAEIALKVEIRTGEPELEISEVVKRQKVDVVVMGKHNRHGIDRWFMGSVTERLLRRLPVPILIIGEGKARKAVPPHVRRIVMTTDFSGELTQALSYSLFLAKEPKAEVTILHVTPHPAAGVALPYEETTQEARASLDRLLPPEARKSGRVFTKIESGVPYKQILNFVKKAKPDLLVMNTRGKGILERTLLGSTAERVIRGASCPVLAIPTKRAQVRSKEKKAA